MFCYINYEDMSTHLLEARLIERPEPAQYCLSEQLRNFFKWYESKVGFPL